MKRQHIFTIFNLSYIGNHYLLWLTNYILRLNDISTEYCDENIKFKWFGKDMAISINVMGDEEDYYFVFNIEREKISNTTLLKFYDHVKYVSFSTLRNKYYYQKIQHIIGKCLENLEQVFDYILFYDQVRSLFDNCVFCVNLRNLLTKEEINYLPSDIKKFIDQF